MKFYTYAHCFVLSIAILLGISGSLLAETPEQLFYRGAYESVLSQTPAVDPQMRVLTLAGLGRFSEAALSIDQPGIDAGHPMNRLISSVADGDVRGIQKRLGALPDSLRSKYTALILASWLSQGETALASDFLTVIDPGATDYFAFRFRIQEADKDGAGQLDTLRRWALKSPGDSDLRRSYDRFARDTQENGEIWDVLFPQSEVRKKVAERAFDIGLYSEVLSLLSDEERLSEDLQLSKGISLYHMRKREDALSVFQSIDKSRLSVKDTNLLQYQTAKTLRILRRYDEAADQYKVIIASDSPYRAQAYYDLYWALSAAGSVSAFAPFEAGFLADEGKSSYYEKWVWDSAWMSYLGGAIDAAYLKVKSYPWQLSGEFKAKVLFWTAEMAARVDPKSAAFYREKCVRLYPFTYYGARLIARYFPSEMGRLSGLFVGRGAGSETSSLASYRTGLGEYEAASLRERVLARSSKVLDAVVLKLLQLYDGLFQPNQAIALLGKMGFGVNSGQATLSREMAEFMYPRPQWPLIQELAKTYDLDPYLILALMREESLFKSSAVSRSGARGLMQIMPATGRGIAKNLKVDWTGDDILFDPETNVRFGVFYLSYLNKRFDGNVVYMLSGYNAGPNATHKWVLRDGGDPLDEFVAKIPYGETHHYVTRVLKSYWIYTLLYNPGHVPDVFRKG